MKPNSGLFNFLKKLSESHCPFDLITIITVIYVLHSSIFVYKIFPPLKAIKFSATLVLKDIKIQDGKTGHRESLSNLSELQCLKSNY